MGRDWLSERIEPNFIEPLWEVLSAGLLRGRNGATGALPYAHWGAENSAVKRLAERVAEF